MPTMFVNNDDDQVSFLCINYSPDYFVSHQSSKNNIQSDSQPFEDETEINEISMVKPVQISTTSRPISTLSMATSRIKRAKTRSYKFIQLERALTAASLLKTNDERLQFESEYLHAIHHRTFDRFLEKYYQKIRDHYAQIKQEQEAKRARVFTFADVEKNFLALDPSRDVKIIFLDEQSSPTRIKSAHPRLTSSAMTDNAAVETFYAKRSEALLDNPALAREEVNLFARRRAERLHERLPRLTSVPHRVKIVDERDISGQSDEKTLLQLKHKRALSVINQRRQIIMKMINQTKKNQVKMEELWTQPTLSIDSSACCRELLERANQIKEEEGEEGEEQQRRRRERPQTAISARKRAKENSSVISATLSNITTTTTTMTGNIVPSMASSSTHLQDSLSVEQMERTKTVRVLVPNRPLTAPTRVSWINYC